MNTSVSPCDNFYEFACGNYAKNRSIPANQLKNVVFYDMQHEFDKELIDLFEKADFENSSYAMKQAKIFYDSCMNQMAHEHYRTAALESILNLFGGWHLLNQSTFNEATFKWEVLAGNMTMVGKFPIIRPVFEVSPNNSEEFILHLEPLRMTLYKFENYFEERANGSTAMELYEQYIPEFLQLLGVNMDQNTMILIRDIIEFEKNLVNITYKTDSLADNSKMMTFGEIKKTYHHIKWDQFFNKKFRHPLAGIPDSLVINVTNPDYFKKLNSLIIKENPATIQNYLMWQLVNGFIWLLHPKFQKPRDRLYWKLRRRSPTSSNIRVKCIFDVKYDFAIPLADELIRKRFKEQDRILVERMTQDIKEVMRKELQNADWMEESTRTEALKKLDNMKTKLEYLDSVLNNAEIQKYYESFDLGAAHYGPNAYWLTFRAQTELLSRLNRKPDIDWATVLFQVNAFYHVNFNKIVIPAGILRFPMFVRDTPPYVSYGSIGMIIGHEVTHGYDSQGSHYDERGNKRVWWDPVTWEKFQKRAQCFIDQYGAEIEPISGKKHNGLRVLGEGIGDNGGLRIAYQAYLNESNRTGDFRRLPDLEDYSSDQMFFISYANTFCEVAKPQAMDILLNGAHSVGATRVNVPVRNFEKFSEVFGCSAGSAMSEKEEDKCRVW